MVTRHAFTVILLVTVAAVCGRASDVIRKVEVTPDAGAADGNFGTSDPNDLCDGAGYAIYDNGVYANGSASCDEPETYCCMKDEADDPPTEDVGNENNGTNWTEIKRSDNPCDGFTGIICHGTPESINCKGEDSCKNATIGLLKGGSCQQKEACKDAAIQSVSTKSCIGEMACAEASIGIVADFSCRGSTACHRSQIGNVTHHSCVAKRDACAEGTIDHVSDRSCQEFKSCSASFLGTILGSSCRGPYACGANLLDRTKTVLEYVHGSCVGPHACHRATINDVTGESCIGDYPCGSYYGFSINIKSVRNRSCIGYFVCMDATMEIVRDQSCVGRDACRQSMIGNLTNRSCFGDRSCQRAIFASASHQSCHGNSSCQNLFVNGTLANSCQHPWMCKSYDHKGDLEDTCLGSLDAPFGPPCSRGARSGGYRSFGTVFVKMMGVLTMKLLFG